VWDSDCVDIANEQCTQQPANDVCAPQGRLEGARLLAIPDSQSSDSVHATADPTDPGFGCYLNFPGAPAADTLWYKFRAPPPVGGATRSIITLGTCASNTAARDSLLQVFAVGDPTNAVTQCSSLISNACNDDFSSCGIGNHNSRLCVRDLVPGDWYYVMVGSKVEETDVLARYRLDISQVSSCNTIQFPDELNDNCPRAAVISDGTTPFDLASPANAQATMTAPLDTCIPNMINDRWYDYTATCSGKLTVQTCGTNAATSPATNLAVYDGLACPVATSPRAAIQCSSDLVDACGFGVGEGSKIVIDAVFGSQYNIRLADSQGNRPSGNLNIACVQSDCPAGEITVASPPEGLVDARRPHSPTSAAVLQTTQTVTVATTRDAQPSCFTACETAVSGSPNVIDSVVQNPLGVYTVTFHRPITPGAKTTVIYTDVNAAPSYAHVVSHPGNVRGDATASFDDVLALRDALIGTYFLPWGVFSGDLNRSETQNFEGVTPADLLEAVDLLNGAGAYDPPANGTPNPANDPACP